MLPNSLLPTAFHGSRAASSLQHREAAGEFGIAHMAQHQVERWERRHPDPGALGEQHLLAMWPWRWLGAGP